MSVALKPAQAAWLLGLAGLIPFVAPAVLALAGNTAWLGAQQSYAACILAFLGALHWGPALNGSARRPALLLAWGVVPSLVAWVVLQAPSLQTDAHSAFRAWCLAAALVGVWLVDLALAQLHTWPAYYLKLRGVLTVLAAVSVVLPTLPLR